MTLRKTIITILLITQPFIVFLAWNNDYNRKAIFELQENIMNLQYELTSFKIDLRNKSTVQEPIPINDTVK